MSFTLRTLLATGQSKVAGTSITSGVSGANASVGAYVLVSVAVDNASTTDGVTNEVTSVTDSVGNTYTKIREYCKSGGAAAAGVVTALFHSVITVAIVSASTTWTANFSSSRTAKAITVVSYTKSAGTTIGIAGTNDVVVTGAQLTGNTLSGLTSREYIWALSGGNEIAFTSSGYSGYTVNDNGTSGGSSPTNITSFLATRVLTATGETPSIQFGPSADAVGILVAIYEIPAGVNVTPGTGVLDLTGIAPTVQTPKNVTPGVGDLQFTGLAPTVVIGKNVFPGVGDLQVTGLAPTVQLPKNVTPGVGDLQVTGFAPSVVIGVRVFPGTGDLQVTGLAPKVDTPTNVRPGVGDLQVTGLAPTIQLPKNVQPGVGDLQVTGLAPTVQTPKNVTPGVGALVLDGFAPVVTTGGGGGSANVTPGVGDLQLVGFAPTVQTPKNVQPGVGGLVFDGLAPKIDLPLNVRPGVGDLTLEGLAPTVTISSYVDAHPGVGELLFTGFKPFLVISGIAPVPTSGQIWPRGNW